MPWHRLELTHVCGTTLLSSWEAAPAPPNFLGKRTLGMRLVGLFVCELGPRVCGLVFHCILPDPD